MRTLLGKSAALKVRTWGAQRVLAATVREVAAAADPATRTFLVKADLGAAPVQLGQTLTVSIELPQRTGITRLPLTAVMEQQGRAAVWLVDRATMTVAAHAISVAGADGNYVIVTGGLSPGQLVVTAGVHVLNPGQKVRLFAAAASGVGVAAAAPVAAAASAARGASAAAR